MDFNEFFDGIMPPSGIPATSVFDAVASSIVHNLSEDKGFSCPRCEIWLNRPKPDYSGSEELSSLLFATSSAVMDNPDVGFPIDVEHPDPGSLDLVVRLAKIEREAADILAGVPAFAPAANAHQMVNALVIATRAHRDTWVGMGN